MVDERMPIPGVGEMPDDDEDVSIINAKYTPDTGPEAGLEGQPGDSAAAMAAGNVAEPITEEGGEPEEEYDFKLPDGFQVDEEAMDELKPLLRELKIPMDKAQKLIDMYVKQINSIGEAQTKARDDTVGNWLKELKADKEIGGRDLKKNLSYGAKVLDRYASPELKDLLVDFGLDKHPAMAKMLVKIGKELSEDSWADGGRRGGAQKSVDDVAKMFFDKTL